MGCSNSRIEPASAAQAARIAALTAEADKCTTISLALVALYGNHGILAHNQLEFIIDKLTDQEIESLKVWQDDTKLKDLFASKGLLNQARTELAGLPRASYRAQPGIPISPQPGTITSVQSGHLGGKFINKRKLHKHINKTKYIRIIDLSKR